MKDAAVAAHAFVNALNQHSVAALIELMTEDLHRLAGRARSGPGNMAAGWTGYFRMVPDYTITVAESYSDGDAVVMLGWAQGTCAANRWQTPAAWKAVMRGSLVAEWRVYADNEPIREILRRSAPAAS